MKSHIIFLSLVLAAASIGCEGKIGLNGTDGIDPFTPPAVVDTPEDDDQDPPPGTIMRPGDDPDVEEVCQLIDPGETVMRRLTSVEYHNSVRAIFDFATIPEQTLAEDERISGFEANTVLAVENLAAEQYLRASEEIAGIVVNSLDGVLALDADEATVRAFITEYGQRAYRRPLATEEVDGLYGLFALGSTEYDTTTGAEMLVEAMLQSPNFLYRPELGEEASEDVVPLTQFEVATRLSYFLWGSGPDATLLDAAVAGELSTPEQVEAQARRLMGDPRARGHVNDTFAQWLRIDELHELNNPDPAFTDAVRTSMVNETRAFIDHVIWEGEGTLNALLTADYTFVDANTAALYGIEGRTAVDTGLVRVDLPPNRKGILSHPGVLAMHGTGQAPVHRGKFIRDAFLCLSPNASPVPDDIIPLDTFEGESMRSKAEKRLGATREGCAGCHGFMDGIGLTFDNFDSLGRYRTEDEFGNALRADGEVKQTLSTNGVVNGAEALADLLAGSQEVTDCMSAQFFRYAFARNNAASDACSLWMVNEALAESGGDIKEMFVALATTDAFLYRRNLSSGM